jgi:hypothetical protein
MSRCVLISLCQLVISIINWIIFSHNCTTLSQWS